MFLSVIIPVYKVEKYLCQCVDSIINQGLDDIEIILVDDGSPDTCPKICDMYTAKHEFVRVIHKINGGLSSARNAGMLTAQGDYLMFVDSDDWWNSDVCMSEILEKVKQDSETEMFLLSSLDYVEGKGLYIRKEHENLSKISVESVEEYYQSLLDNGNLEVSAYTKILMTTFLRENDLYFIEGIVCEDIEWMLRVLRRLRRVKVIDAQIYIYRTGRRDSISNTIGIKNILDLLGIVSSSLSNCQKNDWNSVIKNKELCYCAYLWFVALGLSATLPRNERKELTDVFNSTKRVCKYSSSKKTLSCYILLNIVGFRATSWVLGRYIGMKGKYMINKKRHSKNAREY